MTKWEIKKLAKKIANEMRMPYIWEDIYNRITIGLPLPITVKDEE